MRPHPHRDLAALVALLTLGIGATAAFTPSMTAQAETSFQVTPGSAEPGGTVHLSGAGCAAGGRAEAALIGADGAAAGPLKSYLPDGDGGWRGPYPVPEGVEAGDGYRFTGRCLDPSGDVFMEYTDEQFTIVSVEPTPGPSTSTPAPTSTSSASPSVSASESSEPTSTPTVSASSPPTPGAGSPPPTNVGTPPPTQDDPLRQKADDVVRALEKGNLAFRPPKQMREGVSEEVVIQVRRPSVPGDPATGLPGEGPPVVVPVEVSTSMTAELTGSDFAIEPSGPQRRTLTSTFPAEWRWTVTPKSFGTATLRLRLAVVLAEDPGTPLIPQVTYDEEIEVRVHPVNTMFRLLKTVQGVLTATGLTTAVVVTGLWQLMRRRRNASGAAPTGAAAPDSALDTPVPRPRRPAGRRGPRVTRPRR